jgi:uncharacterized protein (DUF2235 family)
MPRNFVICFDGTNNQFGPQNTSVVRLIQVLDRNPTKQRLYDLNCFGYNYFGWKPFAIP